MLARPLDLLVGPPDPADRMLATAGGRVWLSPAGRFDVTEMHVNPGAPGEPELLPWKRARS